ncbi:MAG: hypothetical protein ACHRXM_00930 [Isosphaerales bacterium]
MSHGSESPSDPKTAIAPMLSVRRGASAIEFYKKALEPLPEVGRVR